MKRRIKINGALIFAGVVMVVAFPAIFLRSDSAGIWEEAAEIIGLAFILLGQLIRVSARGFKAEHSGEGNFLIQGGPYMLVRNPMYLGIILIGTGITLVLFKWWVVCIFLVVFIIRYVLLIFKEEKKLAFLFPRVYQNYCKNVPRLVPSIVMMFRSDVCKYLPVKLSWFKKEIGSITAVLFFVLLIETWKDTRGEGIKAYLEESVWLLCVIVLFACFVLCLSRQTTLPKKDD